MRRVRRGAGRKAGFRELTAGMALKAGDKVAVAGFGTYELKKKAERSGFNPIKKEVIVIPASNAPVLKFGKAFKDMFN